MGVQKPFVVRNGLEVSVDGLVINPPSLNVGIGITNPQYDLDVEGDINYTGTLYNDGVPVSFGGGGGDGYWENQASGIYTSRNVAVGTCITLNANSGIVSACGLSIDGIVIDSANARQVGLVIATEGQTTFNINYSVGYIDVFLNGSRLASTEYTATNGSTVVLTTPATVGDEVQLIADRTFTITNIANAAGRNVEYFTATNGQTTFLATYVVGYVDVYLNGSKLGADEFTATDGSTIVLTTPATGGDEIEIISFLMVNGSSGSSLWEQSNSGIITSSNVGIGTTNPTSRLTVGGNVLVSGVVTATSFVGDGSGLTGLSGGSSSQWETTSAGIHTLSNVGVGTTNPTSELTVSGNALISGVVTATSFVGDGSGLTGLPSGGGISVSGTATTGQAIVYDGTWVLGPVIGGNPGIASTSLVDATLLILPQGSPGDNTFIDSSNVGAALTAVGAGVTYSDAQFLFDSTSIFFDGASYIDIQVSTGVTFAAFEDFTLEFWSYQEDNSDYQSIIMWDDDSYEGLYIYDGNLNWYEWNDFTSNDTLPENQWNHIAVTRENNTLRFYINGTFDSSQTGVGVYAYSGNAAIGVNGDRDNEYFNGYLAGIKFTKGTAIYTSETTIPVPVTGFTTTSDSVAFLGKVPYSIRNLDDVDSITTLQDNQTLVWKPQQNIFVPSNPDENNNVFMGVGVAQTNTSGSNNNFLGQYAGASNETGSHNNFLGQSSGRLNQLGSNNNFFGINAGYSNENGSHNNFFGENAGYSNEGGSYNNFFGQYAGENNIYGSYNNFIGSLAGRNGSGDGSGNNFIGYASGLVNSTGSNNNFIGGGTGASNTTGDNNIFIGQGAGPYNTIGNSNIFIGRNAGYPSSTGNNNIFLGAHTGIATSASNKILIGSGPYTYNSFDSPDVIAGELGPYKEFQLAIGIRTDSSPSKYWIVGNENFNIGIGTTNPISKLTVQNGDIRVGINTSAGLILTDANGVSWRLIVNTDGTLSTTAI